MSAMQEVKKTWLDKFGGELPASSFWVEDVRTNLAKHKENVESLKKSLKEEEVYVQFLEVLLEEITGNINGANGEESSTAPNTASSPGSTNIQEVIKDTLQRRSQGEQNPKSGVIKGTNEDGKRSISKEDAGKVKNQAESSSQQTPAQPSGACSSAGAADEEHFVTVIEVNGLDKEKKGQTNGKETAEERGILGRKPVPPVPPPKNIKRGSVTGDLPTTPALPVNRLPFTSFGHGPDTAVKPHETVESQLRFVEDKDCIEWLGERNVIFDSKNKPVVARKIVETTPGSSSNSVPLPPSSVPSTSGGRCQPNGKEEESVPYFKPPLVKKKFEGSKLPLPPKVEKHPSGPLRRKTVPSTLDLTPSPSSERKNGARSKISDMIGKLEGNHSNSEQMTPRRSFRLTSQQKPNVVESEAQLADYMDPLDISEGMASEEIYDLPPESPASEKSVDVRPSSSKDKKRPLVAQSGEILVSEPMYDTVAPDNENDDDYVVLLDEETGSGGGHEYNPPAPPSSQKKRGTQKDVKADSATIRSQTSIVSGHSVLTTSSGGTTSDIEGFMESPVPNEFMNRERTPSTNYVNLDYFLWCVIIVFSLIINAWTLRY